MRLRAHRQPSRRPRLLAAAVAFGAALALGCPAAPEGASEGGTAKAPGPARDPAAASDLDRAAAILERVVSERCSDPAEPWAVAHRVLVEGAALELEGELAIDAIVARHLDPGSLTFPKRGPDGRPIEPHPGLVLKTFYEVGVPSERSFPLRGGGRVTLAEMAAACLDVWTPGGEPALFDQEWLLETAAAAGDPRREELAARALEVLAQNQAYFEEFAGDPARPYDKPFTRGPDGRPRPTAIHRYACGGFHLLQATQRLHGTALPARLARQYELLWVRLERETAYWEGKLAEARAKLEPAAARGHARVMLTQLLKLQGHGLESWLRAARAGALPGEVIGAAEPRLAAGFAALARTVLALEEQGVYAHLDAIRKTMPQIYLDLVGDSAHALHAVRLRG